MSHREQIEKEMGVFAPVKTARVGRRFPAAPGWAPSHWLKSLKALAKWMLIVVLVSTAAGYVVGMLA